MPDKGFPQRLIALKPYGTADWERAALSEHVEVRHVVCRTEAELIAHVPGVHMLLVDTVVPITAAVLEAADSLRAVICQSTGVDYVDIEAAARRSVLVTNLPEYAVQAVAEHTFALIFALERRVIRADRMVREGRWRPVDDLGGAELAGKVLGIIGLGRIGSRVADIGRALQMRTIGFSSTGRQPTEGIALCDSLEELLRSADIVSIHTSLRPETYRLIGKTQLDLMRPSAVLINVSRGQIIDQDALQEALQRGGIAGAALDVFDVEPPPLGAALLKLENVVLTPHVAWFTYEARERARRTLYEQVRAISVGVSPPYLVPLGP